MKTILNVIFVATSLVLFSQKSNADERHLIVDRIDQEVIRYVESGGGSFNYIATNSLIPWSVALDANDENVYWTEIGSGSIFRKGLSSGSTTESVFYSSNSVLRGLVVDSSASTLYFLDSNTGTLNALDLGSFEVNSNLVSGFIRPNDMVMDRINNNLYITDSGKDEVGCYNLISNIYNVVLTGSNLVDGVWGIDVLPQTDSLYLSDHRTNAIMRADLDGSNLSILVDNQETPRGLCVDRHHGRLYWLEAESGALRSCTLDGQDVQVVEANAATAPRDLASYEYKDKDGDFLNDDWEWTYFGNLLQGSGDDPDSDQRDNFIEQAFGSLPNNTGDTPPGTALSIDPTGPVLTYQLRTDEWMTYSIMQSTNLVSWTPVDFVSELGLTDNGFKNATRVVLLNEIDNGFGDKQFFRVEVDRY
jgi:sugar lactone lactonase YvrE